MQPRTTRSTIRTSALVAATLVATLVLGVALSGAPPRAPALADATAPTVLDATLAHLGVAAPPVAARDALEVLVGDAIARGALARSVMTVVAGGDPLSVDPMLCAHLRREQQRWADVGPIWTRAHAALAEGDADCDPSEDTPCGLVQRLRLQTMAGDELAAHEGCDLDCAHRLQRLQERIEHTVRRIEELDAADLDAAQRGADVDVAALVDEAARTWSRIAERVRVIEQQAPVPDPGFDPECGTTPPFGPGGRP